MPEHVPVSVIVPCHRAAATLARAVGSVMAQTVLPTQLLLVDDASDDRGATREAMEALRASHGSAMEIQNLFLARNGGPAVARNAGWEAATQPLLAFLDADDAWHPRKLALQSAVMQAHPHFALTATRTQVIAGDASLDRPLGAPVVREVRARELLVTNRIPMRTVVLRREVALRFPEDKRRSEDYLLWLRMATGGYRLGLLELPLAFAFKADFGAAGLSGDLMRMHDGVVDTYRQLHREGRIGAPTRLALEALEWAKLGRRYLLRGR